MPTIERRVRYTAQFKRDRKREKKGIHGKTLDAVLDEWIVARLSLAELPERYRDHPLRGDWADHRDSHLKPDLLILYRTTADGTLELVRLGTHSELFG